MKIGGFISAFFEIGFSHSCVILIKLKNELISYAKKYYNNIILTNVSIIEPMVNRILTNYDLFNLF